MERLGNWLQRAFLRPEFRAALSDQADIHTALVAHIGTKVVLVADFGGLMFTPNEARAFAMMVTDMADRAERVAYDKPPQVH